MRTSIANAVQVRGGLRGTRGLAVFAIALSFVCSFITPLFAQLGSHWTSTSFTKKIHLDDDSGLQTFNWTSQKSVCTPACADYSYDSATDTETFRLLDDRTN